MQYLRQSTAATVAVGPFVVIGDGFTPTTGLSTQAGRLVTNGTGAAFTASSWAHDNAGTYLVGLSTTHTATVGRLRLSFSDPATYVPVWDDYAVLSAAVYDVLFGTLAPSTLTALAARTEMDASSTKLASINTALAAFNGQVVFGTVAASPAPTATSFKVTLTNAISGSAVAATFVGLYAEFLGGALCPASKVITVCVVNSTTALTITTAAFAAAPAAGSSVMIGP